MQGLRQFPPITANPFILSAEALKNLNQSRPRLLGKLVPAPLADDLQELDYGFVYLIGMLHHVVGKSDSRLKIVWGFFHCLPEALNIQRGISIKREFDSGTKLFNLRLLDRSQRNVTLDLGRCGSFTRRNLMCGEG